MKTITKQYNVYKFEELSQQAKQKAMEDFKYDSHNQELRNDLLLEDIEGFLDEFFPSSELEVQYSLSYCQGDGVNIYGKLNFKDFLSLWKAGTKEEKAILEFYLNENCYTYELTHNDKYWYSCKFIDIKYIDNIVDEFCEDIEDLAPRKDLIKKFILFCLEYLEKQDKYYEKYGYKYLYFEDFTEEEMQEECDACEWEFLEDGTLY